MISGTGVLVEACVGSVETCVAAERAGARRLELCDPLIEGGGTPSTELITACKAAVSIPIVVMIRPRAGDFVYSEKELDSMRRDVVTARELGVDGIATGVLRPDKTIDTDVVRSLVDKAQGLSVTFHRAFDSTPNLHESLESLIALGFKRVLTSGGAATADKGAKSLADLVRQAGSRLTILAGGGIREHNVQQIIATSGVREVHARFADGFDRTVAAVTNQ
jgi:copper homeostasis protein